MSEKDVQALSNAENIFRLAKTDGSFYPQSVDILYRLQNAIIKMPDGSLRPLNLGLDEELHRDPETETPETKKVSLIEWLMSLLRFFTGWGDMSFLQTQTIPPPPLSVGLPLSNLQKEEIAAGKDVTLTMEDGLLLTVNKSMLTGETDEKGTKIRAFRVDIPGTEIDDKLNIVDIASLHKNIRQNVVDMDKAFPGDTLSKKIPVALSEEEYLKVKNGTGVTDIQRGDYVFSLTQDMVSNFSGKNKEDNYVGFVDKAHNTKTKADIDQATLFAQKKETDPATRNAHLLTFWDSTEASMYLNGLKWDKSLQNGKAVPWTYIYAAATGGINKEQKTAREAATTMAAGPKDEQPSGEVIRVTLGKDLFDELQKKGAVSFDLQSGSDGKVATLHLDKDAMVRNEKMNTDRVDVMFNSVKLEKDGEITVFSSEKDLAAVGYNPSSLTSHSHFAKGMIKDINEQAEQRQEEAPEHIKNIANGTNEEQKAHSLENHFMKAVEDIDEKTNDFLDACLKRGLLPVFTVSSQTNPKINAQYLTSPAVESYIAERDVSLKDFHAIHGEGTNSFSQLQAVLSQNPDAVVTSEIKPLLPQSDNSPYPEDIRTKFQKIMDIEDLPRSSVSQNFQFLARQFSNDPNKKALLETAKTALYTMPNAANPITSAHTPGVFEPILQYEYNNTSEAVQICADLYEAGQAQTANTAPTIHMLIFDSIKNKYKEAEENIPANAREWFANISPEHPPRFLSHATWTSPDLRKEAQNPDKFDNVIQFDQSSFAAWVDRREQKPDKTKQDIPYQKAKRELDTCFKERNDTILAPNNVVDVLARASRTCDPSSLRKLLKDVDDHYKEQTRDILDQAERTNAQNPNPVAATQMQASNKQNAQQAQQQTQSPAAPKSHMR